MSPSTAPTLLTIPSELRNVIYHYIFDDADTTKRVSNPTSDPIAQQLHLQPPPQPTTPPPKNNLPLLQTCTQIHTEAHQLALTRTPFALTGETAKPSTFAHAAAPLRPTALASLRHLTLTARIAYLRSLNEDWAGHPFGNPSLELETLTIVPTRAECAHTSYREVADLSQVHTLAYILAETVKGLRKVRVLRVENRGCFRDGVWRLVYRSLVYRMFRWGGRRCGVRVACHAEEDEEGEGEGRGWFEVLFWEDGEERGWKEVGEEVERFLGRDGEMPNPDLVGF